MQKYILWYDKKKVSKIVSDDLPISSSEKK